MDVLGWGPGAQWRVCQPPTLRPQNGSLAAAWIIVLENNEQRIRTEIDAESGIMVCTMNESQH
jgi:hypothetical protein